MVIPPLPAQDTPQEPQDVTPQGGPAWFHGIRWCYKERCPPYPSLGPTSASFRIPARDHEALCAGRRPIPGWSVTGGADPRPNPGDGGTGRGLDAGGNRSAVLSRHVDLTAVMEQGFESIASHLEHPDRLSVDRRRLIGAYFTHEYAVDAAALSNPSMVSAPNQDGIDPDAIRFVMSLRAIGEGHVSSIQFRAGIINSRGEIRMEEASPFVRTAQRRAPIYDKSLFGAKLSELDSLTQTASHVLDRLPDRFTLEQLEAALHDSGRDAHSDLATQQATRTIHWLASSNYESAFDPDSSISERVLFPAGPTESQGMEDARFVRFRHDDGTVTYFAPYTAFDGYHILPQIIETRDFVDFRIATLNGPAAANKGIALFPRPDRRILRRPGSPGQREQPPDPVRQRALLARERDPSGS